MTLTVLETVQYAEKPLGWSKAIDGGGRVARASSPDKSRVRNYCMLIDFHERDVIQFGYDQLQSHS